MLSPIVLLRLADRFEMRLLFLVYTIGILAGCNSTTRVGYRCQAVQERRIPSLPKVRLSPHYRVVEYDTDSAVIECLPPYQEKERILVRTGGSKNN